MFITTPPVKRTLLELMEAECLDAWAIGMTVEQAHEELDWDMAFINHFYNKIDAQVELDFAKVHPPAYIYQR